MKHIFLIIFSYFCVYFYRVFIRLLAVVIVRCSSSSSKVLGYTSCVAKWFILRASVFPEVKEQIHLSLPSPDHHSLSVAPLLLSSTVFTPSLSSMWIPAIICSLFHPPLLSPFLLHPRATFPYVLPVVRLCGQTSRSRCYVWCFCVKNRNVLLFFCGSDITLSLPTRLFCTVRESEPLLMSSKCEWNELLLTFNPFNVFSLQVDPRHKALWKHSYSSRRATKVRLTSCVDFNILCV